MQEQAEEMFVEIKDLSSMKTESFKHEIIRDLNTKYFEIKLQHEKREQLLINQVQNLDEKLDRQRLRVDD